MPHSHLAENEGHTLHSPPLRSRLQQSLLKHHSSSSCDDHDMYDILMNSEFLPTACAGQFHALAYLRNRLPAVIFLALGHTAPVLSHRPHLAFSDISYLASLTIGLLRGRLPLSRYTGDRGASASEHAKPTPSTCDGLFATLSSILAVPAVGPDVPLRAGMVWNASTARNFFTDYMDVVRAVGSTTALAVESLAHLELRHLATIAAQSRSYPAPVSAHATDGVGLEHQVELPHGKILPHPHGTGESQHTPVDPDGLRGTTSGQAPQSHNGNTTCRSEARCAGPVVSPWNALGFAWDNETKLMATSYSQPQTGSSLDTGGERGTTSGEDALAARVQTIQHGILLLESLLVAASTLDTREWIGFGDSRRRSGPHPVVEVEREATKQSHLSEVVEVAVSAYLTIVETTNALTEVAGASHPHSAAVVCILDEWRSSSTVLFACNRRITGAVLSCVEARGAGPVAQFVALVAEALTQELLVACPSSSEGGKALELLFHYLFPGDSSSDEGAAMGAKGSNTTFRLCAASQRGHHVSTVPGLSGGSPAGASAGKPSLFKAELLLRHCLTSGRPLMAAVGYVVETNCFGVGLAVAKAIVQLSVPLGAVAAKSLLHETSCSAPGCDDGEASGHQLAQLSPVGPTHAQGTASCSGNPSAVASSPSGQGHGRQLCDTSKTIPNEERELLAWRLEMHAEMARATGGGERGESEAVKGFEVHVDPEVTPTASCGAEAVNCGTGSSELFEVATDLDGAGPMENGDSFDTEEPTMGSCGHTLQSSSCFDLVDAAASLPDQCHRSCTRLPREPAVDRANRRRNAILWANCVILSGCTLLHAGIGTVSECASGLTPGVAASEPRSVQPPGHASLEASSNPLSVPSALYGCLLQVLSALRRLLLSNHPMINSIFVNDIATMLYELRLAMLKFSVCGSSSGLSAPQFSHGAARRMLVRKYSPAKPTTTACKALNAVLLNSSHPGSEARESGLLLTQSQWTALLGVGGLALDDVVRRWEAAPTPRESRAVEGFIAIFRELLSMDPAGDAGQMKTVLGTLRLLLGVTNNELNANAPRVVFVDDLDVCGTEQHAVTPRLGTSSTTSLIHMVRGSTPAGDHTSSPHTVAVPVEPRQVDAIALPASSAMIKQQADSDCSQGSTNATDSVTLGNTPPRVATALPPPRWPPSAIGQQGGSAPHLAPRPVPPCDEVNPGSSCVAVPGNHITPPPRRRSGSRCCAHKLSPSYTGAAQPTGCSITTASGVGESGSLLLHCGERQMNPEGRVGFSGGSTRPAVAWVPSQLRSSERGAVNPSQEGGYAGEAQAGGLRHISSRETLAEKLVVTRNRPVEDVTVATNGGPPPLPERSQSPTADVAAANRPFTTGTHSTSPGLWPRCLRGGFPISQQAVVLLSEHMPGGDRSSPNHFTNAPAPPSSAPLVNQPLRSRRNFHQAVAMPFTDGDPFSASPPWSPPQLPSTGSLVDGVKALEKSSVRDWEAQPQMVSDPPLAVNATSALLERGLRHAGERCAAASTFENVLPITGVLGKSAGSWWRSSSGCEKVRATNSSYQSYEQERRSASSGTVSYCQESKQRVAGKTRRRGSTGLHVLRGSGAGSSGQLTLMASATNSSSSEDEESRARGLQLGRERHLRLQRCDLEALDTVCMESSPLPSGSPFFNCSIPASESSIAERKAAIDFLLGLEKPAAVGSLRADTGTTATAADRDAVAAGATLARSSNLSS